ncbi:thiamine-phosphate kinase [Psychromicrobium lacuslunae]|uniref:Thiamine-monophosphate kinase n=1 Tax=Psychromicrobium lacuslunae TaxID=1618207 RepID=A0A0D4BXQ9_9MICC|nr:thiamine-phosphate kinase [Psychromicrobium lacuslunae]AJT41242.1 thiamine-monophosphate kinase [Psychromicrobium lacuslunae]
MGGIANQAAEQTVGQLSETELLKLILPRLRGNATALLGPGDDAAILAAPDGRTVVSIDTQVQDQDFRLEWNNGYASTGFDVGWKSAAQNLSDINAMGAVPTGLVLSLTMPPQTPVSWVLDLADGLSAAISELGADRCVVAGGDLSAGAELVITAAVLGDLEGREAVRRGGGAPGDQLAVAGVLGRAAAGWALLEGSQPVSSLDAEMLALIDYFRCPRPPLSAGPMAAQCGATAMLDISDGLVRDATRLAKASGVQIDLDPAALGAFVEELQPAAHFLKQDPLAWVLGGGEDHGLLCTFAADTVLPAGFTAIGSVRSKAETTIAGITDWVTVAGQRSSTVGWDHFAD